MFVGDILQLRPIKANYIFEASMDLNNLPLYRCTDNLWKSCDVIVPRTNFRQGEEQFLTKCLNRIQLGKDYDLRGL